MQSALFQSTSFFYVYDILFFCLYCITFTLAFVAYLTSRKQRMLYVTALFFVFTLDHFVISMTELIPDFSAFYANIFLNVPSIKTIVYAASFYCMIHLLVDEVTKKKVRYLTMLLIITVICLLLIPMLPNSALKSWIYFFPAQVFLFIYALTGLVYIRKNYKHNTVSWVYPYLGRMFTIILVFSVLIVIEDSYVIFHIDEYNDLASHIFNRNISEDILRFLMSALSIRTTIKFLLLKPTAEIPSQEKQTPSEAAAVPEEKVSPLTAVRDEPDLSADPVSGNDQMIGPVQPEDEQINSVLADFCNQYQLTQRESEILAMLLNNMTNQEISDVLFVSLGTIKTHTHNIFYKLGVSRRKEVFQMYAHFKENYPKK